MRRWLLPLAWIYGRIVAEKRRRWKQRTPQTLPAPAISVGNITVGGTGKTEAAALLCRLLLARGLRPAVLSRGYRRRSREASVVVSRGRGPEVTVEAAGDEPFLLARRLPQAAVVVGTDRRLTARRAVEELGCNVLILDDGFQRRDEIGRDLDLVLVDAADPFGGGHLLPAGNLREPAGALAEADLLLLTRADQHPASPVLAELRKWAPQVPVLTARHRAAGLTPLEGGTGRPLEALRGRRLLAVAGIARPEAFTSTLADAGLTVAGLIRFPDHHWYTDDDRLRIRRRARELDADVIATSKDAVRLGWTGDAVIRGWSLNVEMEILTGGRELEKRLDRLIRK